MRWRLTCSAWTIMENYIQSGSQHVMSCLSQCTWAVGVELTTAGGSHTSYTPSPLRIPTVSPQSQHLSAEIITACHVLIIGRAERFDHKPEKWGMGLIGLTLICYKHFIQNNSLCYNNILGSLKFGSLLCELAHDMIHKFLFKIEKPWLVEKESRYKFFSSAIHGTLH